MKPILSVALLCLGTQTVLAQSGSLSGSVRSRDGRPVVGASVRIVEAGRATRTNAAGRYTVTALVRGQHDVEVRAVGFAPARALITIQSNASTTKDFELSDQLTTLGEIVIRETPAPGSVRPADDVLGTMLTTGAKSEVLEVAQMNGNLAEKTPRQVFSRVPGIFVYDMDGSGNQVNISTRGLDPHRSWEMNVRHDGVLMNSDLYGYPASHYSPPMEAIQRIELIRGTAALQYGSQFGGLLNYITRNPAPDLRAGVASQSTAGSFGLLSTYGSVGGKAGAISYYGYAQRRHGDGYRANASSDAEGQYGAMSWDAAPSLNFRGQVGRSSYSHRIPGPLNDSMFKADPRASTRSRNYFSPDIVIPAVVATWNPNAATRVFAQLSGVFGDRSSVQFVGFATRPDTILSATGQFAPRQVDVDNFRSLTGELRVTREYRAFGSGMMIATGVALSDNDHRRRQLGGGTTGTDFDLTLTTPYRRDIHYRTKNIALYAENEVKLSSALSVVPGVRVEHGRTNMTGVLAGYDPADLPTTVEHDFPLFGVRSAYRWSERSETYSGWSQAYRPMVLQDLLPGSAIERVDPSIDDATGWTAEVGHRGIWRGVSFDVSGFVMRYNNRYGVQAGRDADGPYLLKTNVGETLTRGVELSADAPILEVGAISARVFTATSFFDATYRQGTVVVSGQNQSIVGNRVEAVPEWISRNGLQLNAGRVSATTLVSYVGESFADALNTRTPNATGAVGLVPSYTIFDANGSFRISDRVRLRGGMNNILGLSYFTKRPSFYPGPGVWPSDGRSAQISLDFDLPVAR